MNKLQNPKVTCHCIDVALGTYKNTVSMMAPFTVKNILGEPKASNWVCIDTCIATAIGYLWHNGIVTLNSCCGHGSHKPTVIVDEESVKKIKKLGYQNSKEKCANPLLNFNL
jgi:hypothetical protein